MSRLRGIYAIVDSATTEDPEMLTAAVLRAGVRIVQYRAKGGVERALVRRLHRLTSAAGALLIVNDDLAAALDADGLHAGQEDLAALGRVRQRLAGRVLGVSCGDPGDTVAGRAAGADYLAAGPFGPTGTKADAGPPIGPAGVAAVVAAAGTLPVAAIGGIGLDDLADVAATGARMAAVISAIAGSPDPEASARALVDRWGAVGA